MGTGRVIHIGVRHRANDAQLVQAASQLRKMLADSYSWNIGRDWRKLAANFDRCFRFEVPSVLVSGTSPHEQEDARFGPAK